MIIRAKLGVLSDISTQMFAATYLCMAFIMMNLGGYVIS